MITSVIRESFFVGINYFKQKHKQTKREIISYAYCEKIIIQQCQGHNCKIKEQDFCLGMSENNLVKKWTKHEMNYC